MPSRKNQAQDQNLSKNTNTFSPQSLHQNHLLSNNTKSSTNWRTQIKQTQLITQVSNILVQRHTKHWGPLLKSLNVSCHFTSSLFLKILNKIQIHPQISLNFFNFAKKNLNFNPDLKTHIKLTRILSGSGLSGPGLDSLVQVYPPDQMVSCLVQPCKDANFNTNSSVLSDVLDCYCAKFMYLPALKVYLKGIECGIVASANSCNALLNLLADENEIKLAYCFYGSMLRNGVLENQLTWSLLPRLLYKDGKFERICRMLEMGLCTNEMYDLLIDCYSKRGDLGAAFDCLNEMIVKKIEPSFITYSLILDGACRHQDVEVIGKVMCCMVEKGYLLENFASDYDLIIQKLCHLGKINAAHMFFKRACDEKVELQHTTYGLMLEALSKEGGVMVAIQLYNIMHEKNVVVDESCYGSLVNVLCKEIPSQEVSKLLVDMIGRAFIPSSEEVSRYLNEQCVKGQWKEAEELLNVILDTGCLVDRLSCGSLMKHYCSHRQIDSAIALHAKLEKLNGSLDPATYSALLTGLWNERRVEEAIRVFDYMRAHDMLSSEGFTLMIRGLCQENELRKAMKLHDEMLALGLKPDVRTYKRLISGFR